MPENILHEIPRSLFESTTSSSLSNSLSNTSLSSLTSSGNSNTILVGFIKSFKDTNGKLHIVETLGFASKVKGDFIEVVDSLGDTIEVEIQKIKILNWPDNVVNLVMPSAV